MFVGDFVKMWFGLILRFVLFIGEILSSFEGIRKFFKENSLLFFLFCCIFKIGGKNFDGGDFLILENVVWFKLWYFVGVNFDNLLMVVGSIKRLFNVLFWVGFEDDIII